MFLAFDASLSGSFSLLFTSYGRSFIKLFTTKVADNAVTRALSFKSSKCAVKRFVFAYSYG